MSGRQCHSSHTSHHPQEVLQAQFSLYVHTCGLKPIHFISSVETTSSVCTSFLHLYILLWRFDPHLNGTFFLIWRTLFNDRPGQWRFQGGGGGGVVSPPPLTSNKFINLSIFRDFELGNQGINSDQYTLDCRRKSLKFTNIPRGHAYHPSNLPVLICHPPRPPGGGKIDPPHIF